jgi:hypothetical protein
MSLVIRVVPTKIRNVAELNLPPSVERLATERRGSSWSPAPPAAARAPRSRR